MQKKVDLDFWLNGHNLKSLDTDVSGTPKFLRRCDGEHQSLDTDVMGITKVWTQIL